MFKILLVFISATRPVMINIAVFSPFVVEQLLQNNPFVDLSSKSSNAAEFRNLIITLLEAVNDKSIALSHQKKTNK